MVWILQLVSESDKSDYGFQACMISQTKQALKPVCLMVSLMSRQDSRQSAAILIQLGAPLLSEHRLYGKEASERILPAPLLKHALGLASKEPMRTSQHHAQH